MNLLPNARVVYFSKYHNGIRCWAISRDFTLYQLRSITTLLLLLRLNTGAESGIARPRIHASSVRRVETTRKTGGALMILQPEEERASKKKMPGASRDGAAASTRSVSPFSPQELRPHASLRISWLCPVAASTLCADCEPRIFPRLFHPLYLHTAVCIYIIHAWNVYATFDSRTGRDSTWSVEKKVPRATEFSASDICEFAAHRARQTGRRHLCAIVLGFFRGRKRIVRALIRFHVPLRVGGFGG